MTKRFHSWILAGILTIVPALFAERIPGRYIVELKTDSVATHLGRQLHGEGVQGTRARAQRTLIEAEQQGVRDQLGADATVLDSVKTVANALFVSIPDAKASQLSALPNVRRVYQMRTFHMVLDHAVQVDKVVDAWNQVGINTAGAGVKIAIVDSGIDSSHAGFQDSSLTIPDGFPKYYSTSDLVYTNSKIIVARSYVSLLSYRDVDYSVRDRVGHGTALAMVSAGGQNTGPKATITGVAPKAWLGNYKIFGTPGINDGSTDAAIIKALDDAVADGMDIINLSVGDDLAPALADDLEVQAVEAAVSAGVIVVVAAGNNGPDFTTVGSPATAPSAIAVGATYNNRTFAASVAVDGLQSFVAVPGDAAVSDSPVSGTLADVSTLDGNGLACAAFPASSLSGQIALILRGTCTFESKLDNVQKAGAVGALVYATADSPDPFTMSLGAATLPGEMVSNADGATIKQALAGGATPNATLLFTAGEVPTDSTRLTSFSAAGPGVDLGIKPDMVAVGSDFYVATQTYDPYGDMYDPSGYILVSGTSFSTPMVAGTAALLKSARPGLTVAQYRSLLMNTASAVNTQLGQPASIQQQGGGALNAFASLNASVTATPASLSLGTGSDSPQISQTITLANVSSVPDTFTLTVTPSDGGAAPTLSTNTVQLAPGATVDVVLSWTGSGLAAGAHEGFVRVTGAAATVETHVPYWYDVLSDVPAGVTLLYTVDTGRRGSTQPDALLFRITDSAGVPIKDLIPRVTVVAGNGSVRYISNYDQYSPGMFGVTVRLGSTAGANTYRIQVGSATRDLTITGQ